MPPKSAKPPKFKKPVLPEIATRLKAFAVTVTDTLYLDPRIILREKGFNQRLPLELAANARRLKPDVKAHGIKGTLTIRKEGDKVYLVDGDCRLTVVEELIAEGEWPEDPKNPGFPMPVPCKPEGKEIATRADRLFLQLSLNNSKDFGPFEKGMVYLGIQQEDPSITGSAIAECTGETKQAVSNALRLVKHASPALVDAIRAGTLADSTALEIISKAGEDHAAQDALLSAAAAEAASHGREKIMPKDIPDPLDLLNFNLHTEERGTIMTMGRSHGNHGLEFGHFTAGRMIHCDLGPSRDFQIGWRFMEDGKWLVGHWFQDGKKIMVRPTDSRNKDCRIFDDLRTGIIDSVDIGMEFFGWPHEKAEEMQYRILTVVPAHACWNKNMPAASPSTDEKPETPASTNYWHIREQEHAWTADNICPSPTVISLAKELKGHEGMTLELRVAKRDRLWFYGYQLDLAGTASQFLPCSTYDGYPTEPAAIHAAWFDASTHLAKQKRPGLDAVGANASYGSLRKELEHLYPDSRWQESDEVNNVNDVSNVNSPSIGRFVSYQMTGSPTDPLEDGTFHETERLVLEDRPKDFPLLHLLVHATPAGAYYGYRFDDSVQLPDPQDLLTANLHPVDAFQDILNFATRESPRHVEIQPALQAALQDALARYYPDKGEPEDSVLLAFSAGTPPAQADPAALERIKGAASTERDGTGTGHGNDGRFKDIEGQAKKLDLILEELGDKGDEARLATANLIYNFLMAESSPATVKNHLLGK